MQALCHQRTVTMATPHFWTYDALRDVVWALRRSLRRVPVEELGTTPAANSWKEVQDWLRAAEQVVDGSNTDEQFIRIPAFPLSGVQLRDLEKEITAAERR